MDITETNLKGLFVILPRVLEDTRGFFVELYRDDAFRKIGIPSAFVQENQSHSKKNVLRGLHFQWDPPLGKLIRVVAGRVFMVAVDIRKRSPTLGRWFGEEFRAEEHRELYASPGFAAGFCTLSESADVEYHYTALYNPKGESNIVWNDPTLGIQWPIADPILSPRDAEAQTFDAWLQRPESAFFTV